MNEKILIDAGPSRRGWHRIESFLRCPQLYALRYRSHSLKRDGQASMPLMRGSIGHVGLAHHFARLREAQRKGNPNLYYTPREAMEIAAPRLGPLAVSLLPVAQITVAEYLSGHADEGFKILEVERAYETVLRDMRPPRHPSVADPETGGRRVEFTMRPDLIIEDQSRRKWVLDHKFVTYTRRSTSTRYTNSGQFLALRMLGQTLFGREFGGVNANVLQAAPNCRFVRYPIDPAPGLQARFATLVLDAEERIAQLEDEDRDVLEWPATASEQTCMTAYGACPAFEICRWGEGVVEFPDVWEEVA